MISLYETCPPRGQRLFVEPRCYTLGIVAAVAGIASAGVGIASQVGAFSPGTPSGGTEDQQIGQAIQNQNSQINALTDQVNEDDQAISSLEATSARQTSLEYLSLGLGVISAIFGAIFFFRHRRKK